MRPLNVVVVILSFMFAALPVHAETSTPEKLAYKEATGTVVHVGKQAISVEYLVTKEGSYEMLLPVGQETKLKHVRSFDELKRGDTVRVKYEQVYREGEKGERVILKTTATEIALVRSAPRGGLTSREGQQLE